MECPEFTCVCPMTGQPDFATIRLRYVPAARCVELKSLKLYLWSFRDEGTFHEAVTNRICDDLVRALDAALDRGHRRLRGPRRDPHRRDGAPRRAPEGRVGPAAHVRPRASRGVPSRGPQPPPWA